MTAEHMGYLPTLEEICCYFTLSLMPEIYQIFCTSSSTSQKANIINAIKVCIYVNSVHVECLHQERDCHVLNNYAYNAWCSNAY